jgi:membrane protein implicated in regulation of membrane protease activity
MSYEEPESVVGKVAHVTVAVPGGARPGEVLVRVRGGSESYIAYADEPVDEGVQVVVVADRGARSLSVAPL